MISEIVDMSMSTSVPEYMRTHEVRRSGPRTRAGWLALRLSLTIWNRLSLTIDLERAADAENFLPEQGSHLRSEINAPSEALTCDLTAHDQERDTLPVWMPRIASACNVGRVVSRACENPRR